MIFLAISLAVGLISTDTVFASGHMQSYLPPSFNDSDRFAKLQAVFPEIDHMYKEYAEKNHFPGYAYGIIVDGQLVYSGAGGFIDLDKKTPATVQSIFRIASITKSFTRIPLWHVRNHLVFADFDTK